VAYFIKVAPLRLGLLPDRSSRDGRGVRSLSLKSKLAIASFIVHNLGGC
jgi:hypothetical protein